MVRYKNRYITVEIDNEKPITQPLKLNSQELYNEIVNKVRYIHGIFGSIAVKPGLKVNYCNELTRIAILKVRHGPHKLILSVLPLIQKVKNTDCILRILYVGATLHHCNKAILSYQRNQLSNNVLPTFKFDEETEIKSKVLDWGNINKPDENTSGNNHRYI